MNKPNTTGGEPRKAAPKRAEDLDDITEAEPGRFVRRTRSKRVPAVPLRHVREHAAELTQTDLGSRAGLSQSEVSKIERRSDALVSSLERYARGLGGELELWVTLGQHRYRIALVEAAEE
jgi:hypothetical protein